ASSNDCTGKMPLPPRFELLLTFQADSPNIPPDLLTVKLREAFSLPPIARRQTVLAFVSRKVAMTTYRLGRSALLTCVCFLCGFGCASPYRSDQGALLGGLGGAGLGAIVG